MKGQNFGQNINTFKRLFRVYITDFQLNTKVRTFIDK